MKKITLIIYLCFGLISFGQDSISSNFVLLELFTSQGCSSCPPADHNIKTIGEKYAKDQVYILSYHVDYWDYLGWKDKFSSRENSERQRAYARQSFQGRVYTPQLIVNGIKEFNGGDQIKTIKAINQFKDSTAKATIQINKVRLNGRYIQFNSTLKGKYANCKLNVALVENKLSTKILRGENRNRTIAYEHVVRDKIAIGAKEITSGSIRTPLGFDISNGELVFFLQDKTDLSIKGAIAYALMAK